MVRAAGIDPGTKSMDVYGFDDESGEAFVEEAIPRREVTRDPSVVLETLRGCGEIDAVMAPSGYGIPLKRAADATDAEINGATFMTETDLGRRLNIAGLRELMYLLRDARDINAWFSPGVIQLPTVPKHRKANRIDMGTADKVYTVVAGIRDQAARLGIPWHETSFIAVEAGFGYTASAAVAGGRIIDAVGGTTGGPGYMGMGAMDGELAYALASTGEFSKTALFTGGAASIAGVDPADSGIDEFINRSGERGDAGTAYDAFREAVIKDVYVLLPSLPKPCEILLYGRFTGVRKFTEDLTHELGELLADHSVNARIIADTASRTTKTAAEGAAVVANAVAGGRYEPLARNMGLFESRGGVFDNIYLDAETLGRIRDTFTC